MFEFKNNITIDRAPQEVFDIVSDPSSDAKWRSSNISAKWTSEGPVGVGSRKQPVDKFLGRKLESTVEVTAWDPPNQLGWKLVDSPVEYDLNILLAAEGNSTNLVFNGKIEMGGFFKLAEGLAGKQLEKQIISDFKSLKDYLEAN